MGSSRRSKPETRGLVRSMVVSDPSLASARDELGVSALMRARYRYDHELVDAVMVAGQTIDVFEAARLLLDRGDDVDAHGRSWMTGTPLNSAAAGARSEVSRRTRTPVRPSRRDSRART